MFLLEILYRLFVPSQVVIEGSTINGKIDWVKDLYIQAIRHVEESEKWPI